jgi:hypothetical protein
VQREGKHAVQALDGIKASFAECWLRGVIEDDRGAEAFNDL